MLIGPNCWKYLKILKLTGGNNDSFEIYIRGKRVKLQSIKRKLILWKLEEESDKDVACHTYYLNYIENNNNFREFCNSDIL